MAASTITLNLTGDLQDRIAAAAGREGKTPQVFMLEAIEGNVEAIERNVESSERRPAFVASALRAEDEVVRYGLVHDSEEVFGWFQSRIEGARPERPRKRCL